MRISTTLSVLTVGALAVVGLAGCSSPSDEASSTPTVTDTVTAAPPATSEATATTTPATTTSPSASSGTGGTGTGTQPASTVCTSSNLAASIVSGSGGAAGSVYVNLRLTNKGSSSCTVQGWPGVSLVGGGNGTQIGSAAKLDRSSAHPTITLKAGASTQAQLQYVQADNYERSQCQPAKGDGFRVYPPGNKASVFASDTSVTGCKATSVSLFTVGAFH